MIIQIPLEPLAILHALQTAGYEAYIVGGAVRDIVLAAQRKTDQKITDFDFTTNATPEEIQAVFPEAFYENTFGTVSITPEHLRAQLQLPSPATASSEVVEKATERKLLHPQAITKLHPSLMPAQATEPESLTAPAVVPYEITTFRSDGSYTDHRRPESVQWGQTLEEDLARRDFTINALAISVDQAVLTSLFNSGAISAQNVGTLQPDQYTLIDPFSGQLDLENHIIRTVGVPALRFNEDALRMLRALRFSVQLNMRIDAATFSAITDNNSLLKHISFERIRSEFLKMLSSEYPKAAVELLDETGLLAYIIPELLEGKGVQQGGHHTTDVWTHALDALDSCPSTDPIVRLATLLHDIAKPATYVVQNGQPTFYNHEIIGARMAKKIAFRLRLSNAQAERIYVLVRNHMFHYQPQQTDAAIRRFMRQVGLENLDDILDLREADRLGSGAAKTSWRLEEMKERMLEQLNQPLAVTDLAISGTDLMQELSLQPGPIIGKILHTLFEQVLEDPSLNTKEKLLAAAQHELATDAS
ncbi:HDIG domain-containing protein [Candidatus Woesebacteria bacterium]|nr:HDIG domain-containing protein [Candidatus Woesebacteria bacterium]